MVLPVARQRRFRYSGVTRAFCHCLVVLSVLIDGIITAAGGLNAPRKNHPEPVCPLKIVHSASQNCTVSWSLGY